MDEENIQITLFTRRYNENESRELVKGIWQGNIDYNPNQDSTRHLYEEMPIETGDEEIIAKMTELLKEIKQYQVNKYHLDQ